MNMAFFNFPHLQDLLSIGMSPLQNITSQIRIGFPVPWFRFADRITASEFHPLQRETIAGLEPAPSQINVDLMGVELPAHTAVKDCCRHEVSFGMIAPRPCKFLPS